MLEETSPVESPSAATGPASGRRRGGRQARQEIRRAPLAEAERAVRGGLVGGRYQPLSPEDIDRIHEAALTVLETIGLADALPNCVEATARFGCWVDEAGRLRIPRAAVEAALGVAARDFPLHGQDPRHDMQPYGGRVYCGTAGAAVHVVDPVTGAYRESLLQDLYDAARMVDALDNIHFFQRCLVARDLTDPLTLDINTCYAAIAGTSKHVGTSFTDPDNLRACLPMLHAVAGGEAAWRARPFVSLSCCFVVPPLKFAYDACRVLEAAVEAGMPVLLLSAGQAGATSPAALAGSVVQAVAEVLAGLVYVNALKPGHPCIFGTWPFVSDLRTGAMSGGSGEQALLMAACAQMASRYGLTGGVCAAMTDAKVPDAQAGLEKGYTQALVCNSGANLVYEAAGMHASLLGFCLESLVIDNDGLGAALRTVRGIETDEAALSLDTIADVCLNGPGHYLGHGQTLARMQSDYFYPQVGCRRSPKEWVADGSRTVLERAIARTRDILASHHPTHIPPDVDSDIRAKVDIRLTRAAGQ